MAARDPDGEPAASRALTGGFGYVTAVDFGSRKAAHLQVISPGEIKVAAPAGSGKVADLAVALVWAGVPAI